MSIGLSKLISLFISFCLIFEQAAFAQVAQSLDLSAHFANFGRSIAQTDKFRPLHLRSISYDSQSQDFQLLLDKGDTKFDNYVANELTSSGANELNKATQELFQYFLIGLTLPNDKFWVNLRPDSPDNILDPDLEKTDIGRIFLEADLQLKKDTAQWTSPQTPEGKQYWDKLYHKAGELFGSENITIPTLTRPWIVPNEIIIRESTNDAYIYKATLKVMLEEDYLKSSQLSAGQKAVVGSPITQATVSSQPSQPNYQPLTSNYSFSDPRLKELNEYSTRLIRETIIPKLTYEVNTSKRYAPLRQVYYSLILAQWFKQRFGKPVSQLAGKPVNPLTGKPANPYSKLIDSGDLTNLTSQEPYDKQTYFKHYQKSFADGEYNLQEPVYTSIDQSIRRYMSGGLKLDNLANVSFGGIMVVGFPMIASIPTSSFVSSSLKVNNLEISSNLGIKEAQFSVSVSPLETKDGKKGGIVGSPWEETMTDPNKHDNKEFRYLVHTINRYYGKGSFVIPSGSGEKAVEYIDPLTQLKGIKERKFISTSLIDKRHQNTLGWAGLILKVPEDNILAAEPRDWQTVTRKETVEEMYSQKDRNGIRSPDEILEMTDSRDYNEIVITGTGRRGKSVEIIGVLIRVNVSTDKPLELGLSRRLKTLALKKGWPIIEIREYFGDFKDTEPIIGADGLAFNRDGKRYLFHLTKEELLVVDKDKKVHPMTSAERSKAIKIVWEFLQNNPNPFYRELLKKIVAISDEKLDYRHTEWEKAFTVSSAIEDKPHSPISSAPAYGGIDFTNLPIVTQAITNLGSSPLRPSSYLSLGQLNLGQEYQAIERLASSGLTPSPERLKSFLQASCLQDNIGEDKDKALGLLSEVLRDEEFSLRPTEPGLRDILIVLESAASNQQLKEIFLGRGN